MTSSVALVMDREFGAKVTYLARQMPVWIISSATNDAAVEQARRSEGGRADVTTILEFGGESSDQLFLRALRAIDEHHGPDSSTEPYGELVVFGAPRGLMTPAVMNELGFARMNGFGNGFSVRKKAFEVLGQAAGK